MEWPGTVPVPRAQFYVTLPRLNRSSPCSNKVKCSVRRIALIAKYPFTSCRLVGKLFNTKQASLGQAVSHSLLEENAPQWYHYIHDEYEKADRDSLSCWYLFVSICCLGMESGSWTLQVLLSDVGVCVSTSRYALAPWLMLPCLTKWVFLNSTTIAWYVCRDAGLAWRLIFCFLIIDACWIAKTWTKLPLKLKIYQRSSYKDMEFYRYTPCVCYSSFNIISF